MTFKSCCVDRDEPHDELRILFHGTKDERERELLFDMMFKLHRMAAWDRWVVTHNLHLIDHITELAKEGKSYKGESFCDEFSLSGDPFEDIRELCEVRHERLRPRAPGTKFDPETERRLEVGHRPLFMHREWLKAEQ